MQTIQIDEDFRKEYGDAQEYVRAVIKYGEGYGFPEEMLAFVRGWLARVESERAFSGVSEKDVIDMA